MTTSHSERSSTGQQLRKWPDYVRTPENGKAVREGMRVLREAFAAIEDDGNSPFIAADIEGMTVVATLGGWRDEALREFVVRELGGNIERKRVPK